MFLEPELFWKNFRLGTELQISGTFIYNGLYVFDQMEHFYFEDQCFDFLYNIAVGLERLMKITVVLLEHRPEMPQEDFEKTLITHNHLELLKRIKTKKAVKLGKPHTQFLLLLGNFYKSMRYNRYNLSSVFRPNQEQYHLITFLSEQLKIRINKELPDSTPNDTKIKKFIGNVIGKIAIQLYEIIHDIASTMNIYTYEIRSDSKAFKIFIAKQFNFETEHYLQKELLIYLLNGSINTSHMGFVKSINPLPFDMSGTASYIEGILNVQKTIDFEGELDEIESEQPLSKERMEQVKLIDTNLYFPDDYPTLYNNKENDTENKNNDMDDDLVF